jgi:hypothetical protein
MAQRTTSTRKKPNLRELFFALQTDLASDLATSRGTIRHPGVVGASIENGWRHMLDKHLPWRYCVSKGFVVDAEGGMSDEIDLIIHDRQYSPLLFKHQEALYIPAESVYGVFEIRPALNARNINHAGEKAASVRKLARTSAPFPHASGRSQTTPFDILGGLLCIDNGQKKTVEEYLAQTLPKESDHRLDLLCVLKHASVDVTYGPEGQPAFETSAVDAALIFFFLRLLSRLREKATVPAMDLERYGRVLKS